MNPICITEGQKSAYFKQFDRKRWQFLNAYTDRFKKALDKQIEPVLSELDKGISEAMEQVDIVQEKPIREAYAQLYSQVGTYYASNVFNGLKSMGGFQTKSQEDQFLRFMQSWMETEGLDLVKNITSNTKAQLRELLKQGIEKELSVEEMSRMMRDSGRIGGVKRARVIARTEIIRASNLGSIQGAKNSNLNLQKEWIATRDGRTREDHAFIDGEIIHMDKEFSVGGYPARYPGDIKLPAGQSIQCRCTLAYVPAEMANVSGRDTDDTLPEFREVASIKEAENFAKQHGFQSVNYEAYDIEMANEINKGIAWANSRFGRVANNAKFTHITDDGYFGLMSTKYKGSVNPANNNITYDINRRVQIGTLGRSRKNIRSGFIDDLKRQDDIGYNPYGSNISSTSVHEMTHYHVSRIYDDVYGWKNLDFAQKEARRKAWKGDKIPNDIVDDALKDIGKDRSDLQKIYKQIGEYSKMNAHETISVAVEYEYINPGKSEFAIAIIRQLQRRLK